MEKILKKIIGAIVAVTVICGVWPHSVAAETDGMGVSFNQLPGDEYIRDVEETTEETLETEASKIAIDANHFPDENFRNYLKSNTDIDKNQDGYLTTTEIADTRTINVRDLGIESLEGVEIFTNLKYLYCANNKLKSVDVSGNKKLIILFCNHNQITTLDLSNNTQLENLACYHNQLKALDVTKLINLTNLDCDSNQITELDLSKNSKLEELSCEFNALKSLDLSYNTSLTSLYCGNNYITSLNVSNCKNLLNLLCDDNQLTSLDITLLSQLTWLSCRENMLTELDLSKNVNLTRLDCSYCGLTTLDLSHNTALQSVGLGKNPMACLDVSMLPKLKTFSAYVEITVPGYSIDMAQFPGFDISKVSELSSISADGTVFTFAPYPYKEGYTNSGTYLYDCGNGKVMHVSLWRDSADMPVTSPVEVKKIEQFVIRLYDVCLNRIPDAAGLEDWTKQLKYGDRTGTTAAYGFVFSQEFRNHNYCNQCYVEHLYLAFMGREADAAGLADWVNKLNHGVTREEVFNGFAMSAEFKNLCGSYGIRQGEAIAVPATGTFATGPCTGCEKGDGVGDFVTRLYQVCLDRNPDQAGKDDWCNKLWTRQNTGETTAFGFVFSKEFTNRGLDNSTFIDYMYKAFFDRKPDAGGKAYWMQQMNAGVSREGVFKGFTGSEEFFNLCSKYGIVAK